MKKFLLPLVAVAVCMTAITVSDICGRTALQVNGSKADISSLAAGVYVANVKTANGHPTVWPLSAYRHLHAHLHFGQPFTQIHLQALEVVWIFGSIGLTI